jgi:peptide chain release factor 1
MNLSATFDRVLTRYEDLGRTLAEGPGRDSRQYGQLSKEYSDMGPIVQAIEALKKTQKELEDLEAIMTDKTADREMREMAEAELHELKTKLPALERQVQLMLLPKDEADAKNAILEVRAGTGGDEAALFAAELFRMYQRYAALQGWKFEVLGVNDTGLGGLKEASASIAGRNVFARLKFESGVHRVQRVPATEAGGRIHTSAATVAVLPEAEEVDIQINEADLRIDVYRSSGPGGQSVNTTDSAVRITHIPTGTVVAIQDEKSQHKNRAKAMKVLRARVYDAERAKKDAERAAARKSQVGTGDRSERIRTYNFPQGRVSDHRINLTLYKLPQILEGEALGELIDALAQEHQAELLAAEDA